MAADELTLFFSYLFFNRGGRCAVSDIENAKADAMTAPRGFRSISYLCAFGWESYA